MARPRTPTNLLEARDAFKKHPERRKDRENEPVNLAPLGDYPKAFSEPQRVAWTDIATRAPWLMAPDALVLERAAVLLAELRGSTVVDTNLEKTYQGYVRLLGLPATERSKVYAPQQKPKNKYANLA